MENCYSIRREKMMNVLKEGEFLLLYSGEAIPRSMDSSYDFESNHHFYYLTGLRREKMALLMKKTSSTPRTILFIEEPLPDLERWTGKRVTVQEAREISGIDEVLYIDRLEGILGRMYARENVKAAWFDAYRNSMGDLDSYNMMRLNAYHRQYPAVEIRDAHPVISEMRMVKDEKEIDIMRRAIHLTDLGLRRVLSTLAPGQTEYQAQAEFEYMIRYQGAESVAFPTISGSGINGCMLHYETNSAELQDGELLLMDLGARFEGYSADITRTYPINGHYTERQKQIYDIVLEANRAVAEAARPGITLEELNDICKKKLAEGMLAIGKIASEEEIGRYYMHHVSHHIGIDTHDAAVKAEEGLKAGMVISDEPGLYIDEEKIGIRIEDDLMITEDGCIVLSEAIPRTTEEIEAIMANR